MNSHNSPFSKTILEINSGRFATFLALFSVGWGFCTIRDLYCQACNNKFTTRKNTLLYRLKTLSKIIFMAMGLLVLGIDTSALQEALGIQESTLRTWLTRSGAQSRKLHERFFQDLNLGHIQLDELWAIVKEKEQPM